MQGELFFLWKYRIEKICEWSLIHELSMYSLYIYIYIYISQHYWVVCLVKLTKCKGLNSSIFFFIETQYIVNEEISFKENRKHITKFLKLLKNPNYGKKISKHVKRNIYKCTKVFNFA